MRQIMMAAVCTAALSMAPVADARAQDLQDTLGRLLQGFQGQQGQDQRPDPRGAPQRRDDDRRSVYSDRSDPRDRLRMLDEADRRLDAQQRQIDEDRRRVDAERRRLAR
jgi:hypothetical protein